MPKVSVVIPAYNSMTYLPQTLESVLRQTFTDYEVLIINDGSSDHIVEWANSVTDARVKLISQSNQGISGARNTGIAHAQGEYVGFLDADDLCEPTKLEKQVRCLEDNPEVGLVYTWTSLVDQFSNPLNIVIASHAEGKVWEQIIVTDMVNGCSSAMVRRSCFDKVGVFDPDLKAAEDRDMWIRIAAVYPFTVVKEPLNLYRRHPNNTTKNHQDILQSLRQVFEKNFQSAPLELLYLRTRTYSWLNLSEAWASINDRNYKESMYFKKQAVLHYPQISYKRLYIRLSLALTIIRLFGFQGYDQVREMTRKVRRLISGVSSNIITISH